MRLLESIDIKTHERTTLLREQGTTKSVISLDSLPRFQHINAETIEEAIFLLGTYGERAVVIAGGTDLLRVLKSRSQPTKPNILINIKSISQPKLDYIEEDVTGLKIGALTVLHNVESDELIKEKYSMLAQAAHVAGVPQYRSMATIGGDLCQHVRCWYYRAGGNAFFCYRKGGDICYALNGDNRYHAILGGKDCFAVCHSGIAPALVALNAKVKISGTSGDRNIRLEDFFTTLGNILKSDELLTEIQIPTLRPDSRGIFIKFGLRNAFDTAIASVAAVVTLEDGVCSSVRIVLGGVGSIPWRAVEAEGILVGKEISKDRAESAARVAVERATPLSMNTYKVDVVRNLVKRAVLALT